MNLQQEVHELNQRIISLDIHVEQLKEDVQRLVTRHEFFPVKLIAYGLCACVFTSVLAAILSRVLIK